MASGYFPTGFLPYPNTPVVDGDIVYADHITRLYDEFSGVEGTLGTGVQGSFSTVRARLEYLTTGIAATFSGGVISTSIYPNASGTLGIGTKEAPFNSGYFKNKLVTNVISPYSSILYLSATANDQGLVVDMTDQVSITSTSGVDFNSTSDILFDSSQGLIQFDAVSGIHTSASIYSIPSGTLSVGSAVKPFGTGYFNGLRISTGVSAPAHSEGLVFYDNTDRSLAYYNDSANVTVNIGQEQLARVRNNTGGTITNGTAVHINGSLGDRPTIHRAIANSLADHAFVGLATDNILDGNDGYITMLGVVHGVTATSIGLTGVAAGAQLYLSPTTSGYLTSTRPASPNFVVPVGFVSKVSGGNIDILVVPNAPATLGYDGANTVLGINSTATGEEYKLISGVGSVSVTHSSGVITISGSSSSFTGGDISSSLTPTTSGTLAIGTAAKPFSSGNFGALTVSGYRVRPNIYNEIPGGNIDSSNTTYTLSQAPYMPNMALYYNGVYLVPSGLGVPYDYMVSGSTIFMGFAPISGSVLITNYQY